MNKYFLYTASLILLCASKVSAQVIPYEEPSSFPVDTQYIEQLNRKARASRHIETESGIRLYQEAFMRSHQIGYVDGIARALTGLGLFHMDKGEYAKSAMYYEYAEPFCEASKDGILLVSLYNNKAALYGNRGLSDSAVTYYYRALNLAEKRNLLGHPPDGCRRFKPDL